MVKSPNHKAKGNHIKGKCPECGARAGVKKTDRDSGLAILLLECENIACQCRFEVAMSLQRITRAPIKPPEKDVNQLNFLSVC